MESSLNHYQFSQKFNLALTIVLTFIGIIAAIVLGIIYSIISSYSPLIIIDAGIVIGMAYILTFISGKFTKLAKIRNVKVNFLMTFFLCLFAYYSSIVTFETIILGMDYFNSSLFFSPWKVVDIMMNDIIPYREITITKGKMSRGQISGIFLIILYLIEMAIFFIPAFFALCINDYFCENCQTWYSKSTLSSFSDSTLESQILNNQQGNYADVLSNIVFYKNEDDLINNVDRNIEQQDALFYFYCQCPKCHQKSILTIEKKQLKKGDKGFEVKDAPDPILVDAIFIDNKTEALFESQK